MFGNMTTDGLEKQEDRLGGGYQPLETDIYTGVIKAAYVGKSQNGAMNITLIAQLGDREYRETVYISNRNGENFFISKDKKKVALPGFTIINDLCLILTGEPLSAQQTEEKTVNVYDYDAKKELPTKVDMLTGLLNEEISLAIQCQTVDVNKKNDTTGEYEPSGETRDENVIAKVLHTETKMTVVEAVNGAEAATFWDAWLERNKGKTYDRSTGKAAGGNTGGRPVQRPAAGSGTGASSAGKSLFPKK